MDTSDKDEDIKENSEKVNEEIDSRNEDDIVGVNLLD